MASSHSLYKHKNRFEKATPYQKLDSAFNRFKNTHKKTVFMLLVEKNLLNEEIKHDKRLLEIIKEKNILLFKEALIEYEIKYGKMLRKNERKLEILKEEYFKLNEDSILRTWMNNQIMFLQRKLKQ